MANNARKSLASAYAEYADPMEEEMADSEDGVGYTGRPSTIRDPKLNTGGGIKRSRSSSASPITQKRPKTGSSSPMPTSTNQSAKPKPAINTIAFPATKPTANAERKAVEEAVVSDKIAEDDAAVDDMVMEMSTEPSSSGTGTPETASTPATENTPTPPESRSTSEPTEAPASNAQRELDFDFGSAFDNEGVRVRSLKQALEKGQSLLDCIQKLIENSGEAISDTILHHIKDVREKAEVPKTIIGVIGDTGTGKSTLINALLEEDKLVPTNCMRACTSVVTEISYNSISNDNYLAHVEFISKEEWAEELTDLFERITCDGKDEDSESKATGSQRKMSKDTEIAIAKLNAIFPHETISVQHLKEQKITHFLEDPTVARLLEKGTVVLKEKDSKAFHNKLQEYIDSSMGDKPGPTQTGPANPTTEGPDCQRSLDYWPIIKVVKIFLKSKVLKSGAILVDLPGVKDSNAARNAVSSRYLMNCNSIWIVSPIQRATNDQSALSMLGKIHDEHQLFMDGTLQTATYICTKADDLGVLNDAISSLSLEEEAKQIRARAAAEKQQAEDARKDIQKAKTDMKPLKSQMQRLKKDKKVCKERIKKITAESIESLQYELLLSQQSNSSVSNDPEADTNTTIQPSKSHVSTTRGKRLSKDPVAELERLELELAQHKEQIGLLKEELDRLDNLISVREAEITELEKRYKNVENEIEALCVETRNSLSKEQIRRNFALELKQMELRNGEGRDAWKSDSSTVSDAGDDDNALPVFCVSSRAFQKLRSCDKPAPGRRRNGFSEPQQTEIPQLQEHCRRSTDLPMRRTALKFLNSLDQFLNLLARWSLEAGDEIFGKRRLEAANVAVEEMLVLLKEELGGDPSSASTSLLRQAEEQLFSVFPTAAKDAVENIGETTKNILKITSFNTYQAVFRKRGIHTNRNGRSYDINKSISAPFRQTIASPWRKLFLKQIPSTIGTSKDIRKILAHRVETLWPFLEALGLSQADRSFVDRQIISFSKEIYDDKKKIVDYLQNHEQRTVSRLVRSFVKGELSDTYKELMMVSGNGATKKVRARFEEAMAENKEIIFANTTNLVKEDLIKVLTEAEEDLAEVVEKAIEVLQRNLDNLCASAKQTALSANTEVELERPAVKLEVEEILRSANEVIMQLLERPDDDELSESEEEEEQEGKDDEANLEEETESLFDFGVSGGFEGLGLDFGLVE